ncbi:MAG: hypothetical protein NT062_31345 [Proteobacteria bacterium]|nr:hypothetical protein [Pseudomonadota bacterium]
MYRDVAPDLDEHDGAVGAILIGESLIAGCERAAKQLTSPQAEPWLVVGDAQFFPEVWRHLDRARRLLAQRGTNTATYDDLRPQAKATVVSQRKDGNPQIDLVAVDTARAALESLKLAIPGADWSAIERRTAGLVNEPQLKRRSYKFVGAVAGAFLLATVAWTSAFAPRPRAHKKVILRNELADIAQQRRVRIDELSTSLGLRCQPALAHELVESLALDGRTDEARTFGDAYVERCGEDTRITHWAHAPRPRARTPR